LLAPVDRCGAAKRQAAERHISGIPTYASRQRTRRIRLHEPRRPRVHALSRL